MPANVLDENGFSAPISKSRFNPALAAAAATQQCWLRDTEGRWLHFSGDLATDNRIYRWHGTQAQAAKLREAHPFARSFTKLVSAT